MKIIATECVAKELKEGDLFSTVGPEYWDHYKDRDSIGERVYIRTGTFAENAPDASAIVYRITVETGETICGFCHESMQGGPRCSYCGAL